MSTPFDIFGVIAPAGSKLVAALWLPAGLATAAGTTISGVTIPEGSTAIYLALSESPAQVFGGSADLAGTLLPDAVSRPYTMEVRVVLAATDLSSYAAIAAAFAASASVAYTRDVPTTLRGGMLSGGVWASVAGLAAALAGVAARVIIYDPVQSNREIILRQGVDYLAALGNAISLPGTTAAGVNVNGTTATLRVMLKSAYDAGTTGEVLLSKTCSAVQSGQNVTTAFEITAAELAALPVHPPTRSLTMWYDVHCAVDGHAIPIGEGPLTLKRQVG